jgi:hypothetical protein
MHKILSRQQVRDNQRKREKALQEIKNLSPLALELVKGMLTNICIEDIKSKTELEFIPVMHCMYATTLNADHGFSTTRINRLIDGVNKQFIGVSNKLIDAKTQILDWCIKKNIDFTLEAEDVKRAI